MRVFQKSAQAAQARLERTRNSPLLPGRSESVVRVFQKSAQAAQARHQRARNSPLLPGRSESVVRVFLRKKGKHSVGVARQYCGQVGKQDNCQVAVSLSINTVSASLPIAYELYLPERWSEHPERRRKAGVPDPVCQTRCAR